MARQPAAWATNPDTVRARRMPSKSPVMMRATTRPRRSSGARSAAKGIITCPATEEAPTRMDATAKIQRLGASAQPMSATALRQKSRVTSPRRGCRSPRGTTSRRPAAYPICVAVMMVDVGPGPEWNVRAT